MSDSFFHCFTSCSKTTTMPPRKSKSASNHTEVELVPKKTSRGIKVEQKPVKAAAAATHVGSDASSSKSVSTGRIQKAAKRPRLGEEPGSTQTIQEDETGYYVDLAPPQPETHTKPPPKKSGKVVHIVTDWVSN